MYIAPAEICFGGAIAAGDQARDDRTAAKFVATPVPLEEALRADGRCPPCPVLYRSGDLAMRLPSGNLRFLGRVDRQVRGASHFYPFPKMRHACAWHIALRLLLHTTDCTSCFRCARH